MATAKKAKSKKPAPKPEPTPVAEEVAEEEAAPEAAEPTEEEIKAAEDERKFQYALDHFGLDRFADLDPHAPDFAAGGKKINPGSVRLYKKDGQILVVKVPVDGA